MITVHLGAQGVAFGRKAVETEATIGGYVRDLNIPSLLARQRNARAAVAPALPVFSEQPRSRLLTEPPDAELARLKGRIVELEEKKRNEDREKET